MSKKIMTTEGLILNTLQKNEITFHEAVAAFFTIIASGYRVRNVSFEHFLDEMEEFCDIVQTLWEDT